MLSLNFLQRNKNQNNHKKSSTEKNIETHFLEESYVFKQNNKESCFIESHPAEKGISTLKNHLCKHCFGDTDLE